MTIQEEIKELKSNIKDIKEQLYSGKLDFTAQTWAELQLKEYRVHLKRLVKSLKSV